MQNFSPLGWTRQKFSQNIHTSGWTRLPLLVHFDFKQVFREFARFRIVKIFFFLRIFHVILRITIFLTRLLRANSRSTNMCYCLIFFQTLLPIIWPLLCQDAKFRFCSSAPFLQELEIRAVMHAGFEKSYRLIIDIRSIERFNKIDR